MLNKEIIGFEKYLIYEDGKVYSTITNKFLNITLRKDGYC